METIGGAHAANAISYVLDKEKARKENKPALLAANNIELNPLIWASHTRPWRC